MICQLCEGGSVIPGRGKNTYQGPMEGENLLRGIKRLFHHELRDAGAASWETSRQDPGRQDLMDHGDTQSLSFALEAM